MKKYVVIKNGLGWEKLTVDIEKGIYERETKFIKDKKDLRECNTFENMGEWHKYIDLKLNLADYMQWKYVNNKK